MAAFMDSIHDTAYANDATLAIRIQHIEFAHLRRLEIGGNRIESVEGLHRASMPNLKHLWLGKVCNHLGYNHLGQVSSLRKTDWLLHKLEMGNG